MSKDEKREAYAADITYSTNNELGFDYLRDNMVLYKEQMVQRPLHFAVIDEVDSILVDEARTPLIISGQVVDAERFFSLRHSFFRQLNALRFDVIRIILIFLECADKRICLHVQFCGEKTFGIDNLFDVKNVALNHHINQALKAHAAMQKDVDYVVEDGQVVIVDSFTGRAFRTYGNSFGT
jgi:preprotein translocase subunit SecA